MSFNDQKHCGLLALTGLASGHVTDMENLALSNEIASSGSTNDLWHELWDSRSIPSGNYNDRAWIWLSSIGYQQQTLREKWYAFWIDQCAGGGIPTTPLQFPLVTTLVGILDDIETPAEFIRFAGEATVEDFEAVVHNVLDGEARFKGARRVHNLYQNFVDNGAVTTIDNGDGTFTSSGFTNGNGDRFMIDYSPANLPIDMIFTGMIEVIAPSPTEIGQTLRSYSRNGFNTIGQQLNITLTDEWQVVSPQEVVIEDSSNLRTWFFGGTSNEATQVTWRFPQIEIFTGTQNAISEYVEHDQDHGANVDGVQYFDTDRSGIPLTGLNGILVEQAATNLSDGTEQETVTLAIGTHTAYIKTTDGSGAAIIDLTGVITGSPIILDDGVPSTFEVTTAGSFIFNGDIGATETTTNGDNIKAVYELPYNPTFVPAGETRALEQLDILSPLVLAQPLVNDVIINLESTTVDVDSNDNGMLFEVGDGTLDSNIRIRQSTNNDMVGQKTISTTAYQGVVPDDNTVKLRNCSLNISSTNGLTFTMNSTQGVDPNTDDIPGFNLGSLYIAIGRASGNVRYHNASYKNISVVNP